MRAFLFAMCLVGLAACGAPEHTAAPAAESPSAGIEIQAAWAAPTPGGVDVSAGYFTVHNDAAAADRLIAASSPRAERVEIHEMAMDGAVMRMRPIGELEIPAGGDVALAPGGMHLMFMGVTQPFTEGETIPVQLTFANAGEISLSLPVQRGEAHGSMQ